MKLGQTVYVGPARIEGTFAGFDSLGRAKVKQGGRLLCLHASKVSARLRNATGRRDTSRKVGEAVSIVIYGFAGVYNGEVVQVKPLKARILDFDPIWNGAVLSEGDAKITRREDVT